MKALLQRVSFAEVEIGGRTVAQIGVGLLVFLGVAREDGESEARSLAVKTAHLRIFPDQEGKMNHSLLEISGEALVVSQFTLLARTRRGRRPDFLEAAPPEEASRLYGSFLNALEELGIRTQSGDFQAKMKVSLTNDGPVTILLDNREN
ncbi:MAG: D-aminoacyl-tRNA deacylase [Coprothermobacterota bacterium]|nr:D-aminoacyl-tRNA deacylase [Coprothermobacterota bacterium]